MASMQILNVPHTPFAWLPFGKPFAFGPKVSAGPGLRMHSNPEGHMFSVSFAIILAKQQ
jgi:hypothetical protein